MLSEISAVYTIAGHLHVGRPTVRAAWEPLDGILRLPLAPGDDAHAPAVDPEPGVESLAPWIPVDPTTVAGQRQALAVVLGAWLALGAVRPAIGWGDPGVEDPVVTLGVGTLFGGLVLELLLAIGGQPGLAICSGCGIGYIPRRRPPAARLGAPRASYCPICQGRHAAQNDAARRWRAKNPDYYRDRRAKARRNRP